MLVLKDCPEHKPEVAVITVAVQAAFSAMDRWHRMARRVSTKALPLIEVRPIRRMPVTLKNKIAEGR